MPSEKEIRASEKKNVVVGIRIDSQSRDLLSWALVKVAEPGDCVIAVHVSRESENALREKLLLEGYLEVYEGLCSVRKVALMSKVFKGSSARKVLAREAKSFAAVALVVGVSKKSALGGWTSTAKYCAKRLPTSTSILAIHNGKIIFRSCNNNRQPGLKGDPKPSLCLPESPTFKNSRSEFDDSEVATEVFSSKGIQGSKDEARHRSEDSKGEILSVIHEEKGVSSQKSSPFSGDILEHTPGWPLLRRHVSGMPQASQARNMSVVQWVMNLPTRSSCQISQCSTIEEEAKMERGESEYTDESVTISSSSLRDLRGRLKILLETKSSNFKWFSYETLKAATSQFSAENLIGKGGCNRVYKGIVPDSKPVAVKILKSSRAWKDFAHEVDIISSIKHRHIMPLNGVCIEENDLISVYDFSSKGSLEENLHGKSKDKHALSWEVRYSIAVRIAEALNYLHNECSQPVIHRDVKSSNILLSDEFEPQLSDFGLAIRKPTTPFLTQDEVLGTFGYLAPEYFMYGRVSDKTDVYAFGVVLLELLSGKGPISSEIPKGQESLVMWAKPTIESGDVKGILDPDLDKNINELQLERMALAANHCTTRSSRLRPKISEILKLLRGDQDVEKWTINLPNENTENQDDSDDEVYPHSRKALDLGLISPDVDDDSTSFSSVEQSTNISCEEYLKERWSRSSSFN